MQRTEGELPILRDVYDFILWLQPKIARFPRDQRFTLGERMEGQLYLLLELLIRARYQTDRQPLLDQVNVELEVLRYQVRLAKDLRSLPINAYGGAAERLTQLGRQVGGWRRRQQSGG